MNRKRLLPEEEFTSNKKRKTVKKNVIIPTQEQVEKAIKTSKGDIYILQGKFGLKGDSLTNRINHQKKVLSSINFLAKFYTNLPPKKIFLLIKKLWKNKYFNTTALLLAQGPVYESDIKQAIADDEKLLNEEIPQKFEKLLNENQENDILVNSIIEANPIILELDDNGNFVERSNQFLIEESDINQEKEIQNENLTSDNNISSNINYSYYNNTFNFYNPLFFPQQGMNNQYSPYFYYSSPFAYLHYNDPNTPTATPHQETPSSLPKNTRR